jgi:hypothetical protein
LLYGTYQNLLTHQREAYLLGPFAGYSYGVWDYLDVNWDYFNLQAQQQLIVGPHTLIMGGDYFDGSEKVRYANVTRVLEGGRVLGTYPSVLWLRPPERSYSLYILDYWRLSPRLLMELGLFRDFAKNVRLGYLEPVSRSGWNPRFGVNVFVNHGHTLRFVAQQHLNTHLILQPLLVPGEVAGFPWLLDTKQGAMVREAGAAWEAQWDDRTFSVLRFTALRVNTPEFFTGISDKPFIGWSNWKRWQGSLTVNRILTTSLGLTLGVTGTRVMPDHNFAPALEPYTEIDGLLGLSFLTPRGWQGGVRALLVHQNLKNRDNNLFALVNLRFGKELADKRGLISLEVHNLLNRRFTYFLEPMRDPEFYPARRLLLRCAFYF